MSITILNPVLYPINTVLSLGCSVTSVILESTDLKRHFGGQKQMADKLVVESLEIGLIGGVKR